MKKRIVQVVVVLLVLSGVMILSYPSFANYINNKHSRSTIVQYRKEMESSSEKELNALSQEAHDYNQTLPWAFPADPFSKKNIIDTKTSEFKDFKLIQSGSMIGYVEIPKIDVYLPIYYGTSKEVLNKGIGLIENTSLPVGGQGTHAVLSGHSGLPSMKLFTDINQLENGDQFFVHVLNNHFAYQVNQQKTVLPDDVADLMIEKDKDYISLLTCTPYGINTHRLIVRGERIDYDFSKNTHNIEVMEESDWLWLVAFGILGVATIGLISYRKKGKNEKNL